jgi:uncharacterized protein (TIGR03067 family)
MITLTAALVGLFFTMDPMQGSTPAEDIKKLSGAWMAVAAERDGKPAPDIRGHRLVFMGEKFTIFSGGKVLYQGAYKLNPGRKPAQIDFVHTAGELKGKIWQGIYELDGESLKICDNAAGLDKPRPGQFLSRPDSGAVLVVFKRTKG